MVAQGVPPFARDSAEGGVRCAMRPAICASGRAGRKQYGAWKSEGRQPSTSSRCGRCSNRRRPELAAIRATESHLRRIETRSIKRDQSTWKEVEEHNLLLHTAIIDAAGNPILSMINSALTRFLHRSREITGARAPDCKEMLNAHSKIVDAILKGDVEEAEQAMLGHLHRVAGAGPDLRSQKTNGSGRRSGA